MVRNSKRLVGCQICHGNSSRMLEIEEVKAVILTLPICEGHSQEEVEEYIKRLKTSESFLAFKALS